VKKDQNCILSPDSDGLLCGLFMSHYLNWNIIGFYDGKVLVIEDGYSCKDSVFLDIEIYRKDIRSVGHHMVLYNKKRKPFNWDNFKSAIQPNILRNYDTTSDFRLKYPLATIHLLIGILGSKFTITIPESAICPLLFTDGVFNVLFKYPENVLNWLSYLKADEEDNPLHEVFLNDKYSVYTLMKAMDDFFRSRDKISVRTGRISERGDRLKISHTDGSPFNIIKENTGNQNYKIDENAVKRISKFLILLSKQTKWNFKEENWSWKNYNFLKFSKSSFQGDEKNLTNANYDELMKKNPLSWAMTGRGNLEYTLEEPDKLI